MRSTLSIFAALSLLAGCQTQQPAKPAPAPVVTSIPTAPELSGLNFLTGRWIAVEQSGGVTEEHWFPARGNTMMGMVRAVRPDSSPQGFGVMTITVEPEGVIFRRREYGNQLSAQNGQTEAQVFRLTELTSGRVVFSAIASAGMVDALTYTATRPNQLTLDATLKPGFSITQTRIVTYTRDPQ